MKVVFFLNTLPTILLVLGNIINVRAVNILVWTWCYWKTIVTSLFA